MSLYPQALIDHLATGCTTLARAFAVTRRDGVVMGFTDHDRDLAFDGITFRADSGLTAKALQMGTGLAVDNSEAVGVLRSDAITEADILAGRYDGAEVRAWLVNWADVTVRALQFRGTLGEITRGGGAFTAELRGLSERLNQPQGRIYHPRCSAVLGDRHCRFDLAAPGYAETLAVEVVEEGRIFRFAGLAGYPERFFEKGRFQIMDGAVADRRLANSGQRGPRPRPHCRQVLQAVQSRPSGPGRWQPVGGVGDRRRKGHRDFRPALP